jgi:hypothetical protein
MTLEPDRARVGNLSVDRAVVVLERCRPLRAAPAQLFFHPTVDDTVAFVASTRLMRRAHAAEDERRHVLGTGNQFASMTLSHRSTMRSDDRLSVLRNRLCRRLVLIFRKFIVQHGLGMECAMRKTQKPSENSDHCRNGDAEPRLRHVRLFDQEHPFLTGLQRTQNFNVVARIARALAYRRQVRALAPVELRGIVRKPAFEFQPRSGCTLYQVCDCVTLSAAGVNNPKTTTSAATSRRTPAASPKVATTRGMGRAPRRPGIRKSMRAGATLTNSMSRSCSRDHAAMRSAAARVGARVSPVSARKRISSSRSSKNASRGRDRGSARLSKRRHSRAEKTWVEPVRHQIHSALIRRLTSNRIDFHSATSQGREALTASGAGKALSGMGARRW